MNIDSVSGSVPRPSVDSPGVVSPGVVSTDDTSGVGPAIDPSQVTQTPRPLMDQGVDSPANFTNSVSQASSTRLPAFAGNQYLPPASQAGASQALSMIHRNVTVDVGEIAALVVMVLTQMQKSSSEARVDDMLSVANANHQAADDLRAGAAIALGMGIASTTLTVAAAASSIAGGVKSFQAMNVAETEVTAAPEMEEPEGIMGSESTTGISGGTGLTAESVETESTQESMNADVAELAEDIEEEKPTSVNSPSTDNMTNNTKQMLVNSRVQALGMFYSGISSSLEGVASGVQAGGRFGSDTYSAKSKDDEANAQLLQAQLEKEREFGQSASQSAAKIMDTLDQIYKDRHEASTKIMDSI